MRFGVVDLVCARDVFSGSRGPDGRIFFDGRNFLRCGNFPPTANFERSLNVPGVKPGRGWKIWSPVAQASTTRAVRVLICLCEGRVFGLTWPRWENFL